MLGRCTAQLTFDVHTTHPENTAKDAGNVRLASLESARRQEQNSLSRFRIASLKLPQKVTRQSLQHGALSSLACFFLLLWSKTVRKAPFHLPKCWTLTNGPNFISKESTLLCCSRQFLCAQQVPLSSKSHLQHNALFRISIASPQRILALPSTPVISSFYAKFSLLRGGGLKNKNLST